MPLTTTVDMLRTAQEKGYAIGAFNIENMEMAQAVVAAAEEAGAPVILQTTYTTVGYASLRLFRGIVSALAEGARVPVALHLDHGNAAQLCMDAADAGYTSVMMDGSRLEYEENVRCVRAVRDYCARLGVPTEAELGAVGGKEDEVTGESAYTDPSQAADFEKRTGIQSLAVAIGTAHGVYKTVPKLDVKRLAEIRKVTTVPLVLHGASGLSAQAVRDCVAEGICKVNFATELRAAFMDGVKEALKIDPSIFDPKKAGKPARENVKQAVLERIMILGCAGRA